jgi:pre-mRNA-splicing factor SYF2
LSRKQYRKNIDEFKPDYASYNAQRSKTSSSNNSAAIIAAAAASGSISKSDREIQEATDDLYRDAHSFVYADHVPSEDAIDRVVGKINLECVLLSFHPARSHTMKRHDSLTKFLDCMFYQ